MTTASAFATIGMKRQLGVRLKWPTYREGLAGLLAAGE
jgi:hypothetical protein